MLFQGIKYENGWVVLDYFSTWNYGYDFMLDACQTVCDTDFKDKLQQLCIAKTIKGQQFNCIDDLKKTKGDLRACEPLKSENDLMVVVGYSDIMECLIHICFYKNTNIVKVYSPSLQYFKINGEHVLDNYMNSIEIKAYCMEAERNAMLKIGLAS